MPVLEMYVILCMFKAKHTASIVEVTQPSSSSCYTIVQFLVRCRNFITLLPFIKWRKVEEVTEIDPKLIDGTFSLR